MYKSILVPIDGSTQSHKALTLATNLLDPEQGMLYILSVQEAPLAKDALGRSAGVPATNAEALVQESGQALIKQACQAAKVESERVKHIVRAGQPATGILAEANQLGVDAIVMGSRGNSNIKSLVIGSVSHRVLHVATCAVVIVR
ncbi:universal stress protein [Halomonas sp. PR-M31]|uniref:universal stress protein n=1 Tax=Halomonas sp. PR-M31 TaxID=1471202 RepID=UPI000651E978|nr:universal stress protein [Halomonas sp. PR-M31]